jgi:MFS family permease
MSKKSKAYAAIISFGIVSMLGDIVYEGGRGLSPEYLSFLGASAVLVGSVSGVGEALGRILRLVSGVLADKTRTYWLFIFMGYGLIAAIPIIGLTRGVEVALFLIVLERLGKALRTPSRDTVISVVSQSIGSGKAFGLHEFLDQLGAIIGPGIVSAFMFYTNNYSAAFILLFIPFAALLLSLLYTYNKLHGEAYFKERVITTAESKLNRSFYTYSASIGLNTIGLMPIALILYKASISLPQAQQWIAPLLYLLVQLVDAPTALVSGILYDRIGIRILIFPFALSVFPSLFAFWNGLAGITVACLFYGIVLGMQESVYRAAVSELVPVDLRGTAYGIFNTVLGLSLIGGGLAFGFFMDKGLPLVALLLYAAVAQSAAVLLLLRSARTIVLRPKKVNLAS